MKSNLLSFKGPVNKSYGWDITLGKAIEQAQSPNVVEIPLSQHSGTPAVPIVSVGDYVKMGQKIGQVNNSSSANVHASVSGKVAAIKQRYLSGVKAPVIVIENDGKDLLHEGIKGCNGLEDMSPQCIMDAIQEAGIIGMSGGAAPVITKLEASDGHGVNAILVSGVEHEPYLASNHRLMAEKLAEVVLGLKALLKGSGIAKGYIAAGQENAEVIRTITEAVKGEPQIDIINIKGKYPQRGPKHLAEAIKAKMPDVSECAVFDANTATAVYKAVIEGIPVIERVVTVAGSGVKESKNLSVRIGTSFKEVIDQCGGLLEGASRLISGGPMTGTAQYSMDDAVTKDTAGIIVLAKGEVPAFEASPCIRCGRCIDVCPAGLMPLKIVRAVEAGDSKAASDLNILDCSECGWCNYVCPAKRQLVQNIQIGKIKMGSK